MKYGTLYLIPTFLSEDNSDVLPASVLEAIHQLNSFIVEDEKSARRFLKKTGTPVIQASMQFQILNEHTPENEIPAFLQPLLNGQDIGLMSEAGCPGVADPGSPVVRLAHEKGIRVMPLVGPSSILLALMGSGLNGQNFRFHGYLPRDPAQRKQKLKELEKEVLKKNEAQLFIETPYRNQALFTDILASCQPTTLLCIACDLTSTEEFLQTKSLRNWKNSQPAVQKRPCIFILGT